MNNSSDNNVVFDSGKKASRKSGKPKVGFRGSERYVKTYTIFETEKKAYSTWNDIKNNSYNYAYSFLFFGVGLLVQTIFSGWNSISYLAQSIVCLGVPLSCVLAAIFFNKGKHLSKSVTSLDELIEKETQHDH